MASNSSQGTSNKEQDELDGSGNIAVSKDEQSQIDERARPNAIVVHEIIRQEGDEELKRPFAALAFSGLAAGLSMGFSLVAESVMSAELPHAQWRPLVANLGYTVGFIIVIGGRQQLFTENTLTPVLPFLNKPTLKNLALVLRLWAIVLTANLIGSLIFAFTLSHSDAFNSDIREQFGRIAIETLSGSSLLHFVKGIFAGWILALVVWILPAAESKLAVVMILTYVVGIAGFSHVIAGSTETMYLVLTSHSTWSAYFCRFMLPTLIGNTVGGVTLVAALNYGQVAPEQKK